MRKYREACGFITLVAVFVWPQKEKVQKDLMQSGVGVAEICIVNELLRSSEQGSFLIFIFKMVNEDEKRQLDRGKKYWHIDNTSLERLNWQGVNV